MTITRAELKQADPERYEVLRRKHVEANRKWRESHPDRAKAAERSWYEKNKDHANATSRAWNDANKDRREAVAVLWRAQNKAKDTATKAAWKKANPEKAQAYRDAWLAVNREKNNAASVIWRRANPDKAKATQAASGARRRADKAASSDKYTSRDVADLLSKQKQKCAHSWCRVSLRRGYHVDHIIPLAKGGSNGRKNIQLLCQRCNVRKSAKHPVQFALEHGMLV